MKIPSLKMESVTNYLIALIFGTELLKNRVAQEPFLQGRAKLKLPRESACRIIFRGSFVSVKDFGKELLADIATILMSQYSSDILLFRKLLKRVTKDILLYACTALRQLSSRKHLLTTIDLTLTVLFIRSLGW
ncbi:hypothetical protein OUZ56_021131 [Daphnia magna]|uniref:Uncharacterized protein n=1 Tax=Daphnia magna TaxID=35525 RepID=A0ABQ9ZGH4_9CRUS|nr:hypothetical protein OUZ56_021131 [Daphnia magna]